MSRYLWAVGEHTAAYQTGDILADRYLCKGPRIFLDTKPALLPTNLDEVPEPFIPYLKLSPNQLHIPQIYDWVEEASSSRSLLLLLDQAPLYVPRSLKERGIAVPASEDVQILPMLVKGWQSATAMRQLHWLWQIATLWHPMQAEGVASSLLIPELLRTEGSLIRLLQLQMDGASSVSLSNLGEFWTDLAQTAQPEIQAPLQQLCQDMVRGAIRNAEEVINQLDGSIAALGQSQQSRQIQIATLSDQGPSRQRNEDACYPLSGTVTNSPPAPPLLIVCDGIGGHQGGDVASNLAIKALEQHLKTLQPDRLNAVTLEVELEKAVSAANDLISQQNDSEQRFDRQRMGTTVVMGLIRAHELYITHVGDSRAYWITRWGCHQITQDDDVASREVRLGYSSYPQALQQPSAGSLVQALGMGSATNLYPTVQRFILDEDCVFLLCSDGLSDNDQVEEHWEEVILPLLDGRTDLATVSQQWVDIANRNNGYDNTTVGLIHCKIVGAGSPPVSTAAQTTTSTQLPPTRPPGGTALFTTGSATLDRDSRSDLSTLPTTIPTQRFDRPKPTRRQSVLPLLASVLALSLIAAAIFAAMKWFSLQEPGVAEAPSRSTSPVPSSPSPLATESAVVDRLEVTREITVASNPQQFDQGLLDRLITPGSIVEPVQQDNRNGKTLVQLEVCTASSSETTSDGFVTPSESSPPEAVSPSEAPEGLTSEQLAGVEKNPAGTSAPKPLLPGESGWISSEQYQRARSDGFLKETTNSIASTPNASDSSSTQCGNSTNSETGSPDEIGLPETDSVIPSVPSSPSTLQSPSTNLP